MKTALFPTIFIITGIVILMYLGNYIVSIKAIPSLPEYLGEFATSSEKTSSSTDQITIKSDLSTIKAPNGTIHVEIVNTPDLLIKGLSYRDSLPSDQGMLFVFPESDKYSFWMKDMNFPIDIIWIDANKNVVGIDPNVLPETYPQKYSPSLPIKYVLELNANIAKDFGITIGTQLGF